MILNGIVKIRLCSASPRFTRPSMSTYEPENEREVAITISTFLKKLTFIFID